MSKSDCFAPSATRTRATLSNSWSLADIRRLRDFAQQGLPLRVIAEKLTRTESAIKNKAGMHGISLQRQRARVIALADPDGRMDRVMSTD